MEIIKLNLIPNGVNPTCHCSQYDNGRVIRCELFNGLTPYTLANGDTVTLNARKPDNTIITASITATQGNNYVDITTTEQLCAVVGETLCKLKITNGSKVIGTLNFIMAIERDVLADGIPSQSVIEDLDELVQEAVGDNYYTKTETDDLLDAKADKSTTYTKTQVDSALALKANSSDVYTKTQIDTALEDKADKATTYTKTETDTALALKADKSELYNVYPTEQESGAIAHFTDGADNIPVKSLVSQIVAVQSGSGTPSPSNPRAISGFSSVNVYVTGKNLFNLDKFLSDNNVSYTKDGEWFLFNLSNDLYNNKFDLLLDNYSVSFIVDTNRTTATNPRLRLFKNGGVEGEVNANSSITKAIDQISFNFSTAGTICCKVQAEFGTTTSYEPFGNTYTFTFGQTVYGGNLNVTTGLLTITHAYNDLGTLPWQQDSAYGSYFYTTGFSNKKSGLTNMICNKYANATGYGNQQPDLTIRGAESGNVHRLFIRDNSCADITAFNTAIQGTMLCYEIETSQTVQLTPTEVKTLLGANNIFADTGDVAVNYRADIGLYIDKKISQIPTALNSTRGSEELRTISAPVITDEIRDEEPIETPTNDEER